MVESNRGAVALLTVIVLSLVVLLLSATGHLLKRQQSLAAALASSSSTATTTTTSSPVTRNIATEFTAHLRFPPTLVGKAAGKEEIIDLQSQSGHYDAGFVCKVFSVNEILGPIHSQRDSHLVRVKPVVTELENYGSIVHHMDIFTCQDTVVPESSLLKTRVERSNWCSNDKFLDTSCKQVIWVYDRGADMFEFPKEAGILFGPNSGFTHLLLQIHYLLPEKYMINTGVGLRGVSESESKSPYKKGLLDSSGFEMIFDTKLRPNDSSIFGFLDLSINVPPNTYKYVFKNHVDSLNLAKMIAPDLLQYGYVKPFAVHLHAHNYAKSVKLEHYRNGKMLKT
jgi:hypothetical protein